MTGARPRLGLLAVAVAAVWTVIGGSVVHAYLPPNAILLPYEGRLRQLLIAVAPQGWAFFTRNPREDRLLVFARTAVGWRSVHAGPHSEPRHVFGFDRSSRAQGVELGLLRVTIPTDRWSDCDESITTCVADLTPYVVTNPSPHPTLCGDIALAYQEPVPWAWADQPDLEMPSRAVRLSVNC